MTMVEKSTFVRGNERLRKSLEQPGMAQAVAEIEAEAAELDRTHAMSLAMIREAGRLTQTDIARALNVTQGAISQVENRGDVLLSTLRNYLLAAGASDPRIVVALNGHDVVVDLATVAKSA
jgi:DNA-binding transcriptional regulator YiaG